LGLTMPTLTLAEIDATARKAARGCGCPWGLAEEAGKSARWLASHGLPGPEALAALLADRDGCCTGGGPPCALVLAATLADRAPLIGSETVEDGGTPLLILAQMGRTADASGRAYALDWPGGGATVARHGLTIRGGEQTGPITCTAVDPPDTGTPPSPASRRVDEGAWTALTRLSHRILVPATEASRAGAGAGTNDAD